MLGIWNELKTSESPIIPCRYEHPFFFFCGDVVVLCTWYVSSPSRTDTQTAPQELTVETQGMEVKVRNGAFCAVFNKENGRLVAYSIGDRNVCALAMKAVESKMHLLRVSTTFLIDHLCLRPFYWMAERLVFTLLMKAMKAHGTAPQITHLSALRAREAIS